MKLPAEAVLERHAQLGLSPSLRVEVRGVHLARRELRLRVGLEEVELVRDRIVDLRRELLPVVAAERGGLVEDLAEGGRRHVAAEVDAVEAKTARDRDVLGRLVDEERTALVRARAVALGECEQLVGDDDSGDLSLVKGARCRRREEIDVRDHRQRQLLASDPPQELVVLACVPADLVDHEARAGLDLLPQLEVLRHHLALAPLVVRDDATEEEIRPVQPSCVLSFIAEAGVHLREEAEQARPSRCRTPAPRVPCAR